ncbi:MAG TPA: polyprenyl synthetase family protein [Candidatus Saccharimonadales bacterium]
MAGTTLGAFAPYKERIDAALDAFFRSAATSLGVSLSDHSRQALAYLEQFSARPGKRIRGSLASLAYDTAAGTHYAEVGLQLGVVLELMQDYLLIIDDVMDKSALRRGEPTLHVLYGAEAKGYGGAHEANMLAVNVGELAQHLANLLLARLDVLPERLRQALHIMHTNIIATGFGQLDDLYQQPGRVVSEDDIIRKYQLKSSRYTFINPLQLGFVLAGEASEATLAAALDFGQPAGIAFQLHDDYLGIFGTVKVLGKPNLDDVREGKFTLLMHYALRHAESREKQRLQAILGNPRATGEDLAAVQAILASCGAKDYNAQQARTYADKAKRQLGRGPLGGTLQNVLQDLVEYSITRQQ